MEVAPIQIVECKGLLLVLCINCVYFLWCSFCNGPFIFIPSNYSIYSPSQRVPFGRSRIFPNNFPLDFQHRKGWRCHQPTKGHLFGQKRDPSRRSKIALPQSGHCDWRAGQGATDSRIRAPWFLEVFEATEFRVLEHALFCFWILGGLD